MFTPPVRVCFVCSGNICRSPTAEVVLRAQAEDAGLGELVTVSSAGTGAWHVGEDMDERARRTLVQAGYDPKPHVANDFDADDFAANDIVVALDSTHHRVLWDLAGETPNPVQARAKIAMLRTFDPQLTPDVPPDVPDPYFGGAEGFEEVLGQVERSCAKLLELIRLNAEA